MERLFFGSDTVCYVTDAASAAAGAADSAAAPGFTSVFAVLSFSEQGTFLTVSGLLPWK